MAAADTNVKNSALLAIRVALDASRQQLIEANRKDLERGRANGLDAALLDRLELKPSTIDSMLEGLGQVAALTDLIAERTPWLRVRYAF